MLVVMTTVLSASEGETLAEAIINAKLAGCVQILPQMTSIYMWEGEVQREGEHLLLIKTLPEKWDELAAFITANHPYDVPEIIAVDVEKVSALYQNWIKEVIGES